MGSIVSGPGDNATLDRCKELFSISQKAQANLQGGYVESEFHFLTRQEPIVYGK